MATSHNYLKERCSKHPSRSAVSHSCAHEAEEERNRQNWRSAGDDNQGATQRGAHMEFDYEWQCLEND